MVIVVQFKFDLFQMINVGEEDITSIGQMIKKIRTEKQKIKKRTKKKQTKRIHTLFNIKYE